MRTVQSIFMGGTGLLGQLHHVEIYAKNLEISKAFWGWLLGELGYEEFQKWKQGISYKLGETYIVFVQADDQYMEPPYHRCRVGLNHLAFHGRSREFVDELTDNIRSRGIKILYEDRHPFAGGKDYYAVFFEDPDRIKVEIVAE